MLPLLKGQPLWLVPVAPWPSPTSGVLLVLRHAGGGVGGGGSRGGTGPPQQARPPGPRHRPIVAYRRSVDAGTDTTATTRTSVVNSMNIIIIVIIDLPDHQINAHARMTSFLLPPASLSCRRQSAAPHCALPPGVFCSH